MGRKWKKSSDRESKATGIDVIPRTWTVYTTASRGDSQERLLDLRHLAVTKFHKAQIQLTGYTLDRWDLHGVPCECLDCAADYEALLLMQRDQNRRLLREPS
jgi:hypothetical protein